MYRISDLRHVLKNLDQKGFVDLGTDCNVDILDLARLIGKPVSSVRGGGLVDYLGAPRVGGYSRREFAIVYQDGVIPFHTDCAYHSLPPRFVIMRLQSSSVSYRATQFIDLYDVDLSSRQRRILKGEVWYVEDGLSPARRTRVLRSDPNTGRDIFAWDLNCMRPYFKRVCNARHIIDMICVNMSLMQVAWVPNQTIIFDNWRFLHAVERVSGDLNQDSIPRVIERALVG